MTRTRILLIMLIALGALCIVLFVRSGGYRDTPIATWEAVVTTPSRSIGVTIADTPTSREQGLSGTATLVPHTGKLFVFQSVDTHGFWMKDMSYPIDIVWIATDGTVVGITPSVAPNTYPKVFYPPTPVRFVLELNASESSTNGIFVGTKLILPANL